MGKVNIKQLNFAPNSGYVIGSGAGGVPIWKLESSSVDWSNITGNQAVINLSGFTNNAGFITLGSLSAGTGISYNNLTGVITNTAPDSGLWTGNSSQVNTVAPIVTLNNMPIRTNVHGRGVYIGPAISTAFNEVNTTIGSVLIGEQAGGNLTGTLSAANVFIGSRAGLQITTGARNLAIGTLTLGANATSASTVGSSIGIGQQAGAFIITGTSNVLIGNIAGIRLRNTADYNTVIGAQGMGEGSAAFSIIDNATYNTAIGARAMGSIASSQTNNLALGAFAMFNANAFSNTLFINSTVSTPANLDGLIVGNFVERNVGINIDPSTIHASAMLQVESSTKGVLHPLLTTIQKNAIASPATGLQLVDTDLDRPVYKTASGWQSLAFLSEVGATITLSGDVTGSGTTAITTTIANNAVTDTKIRQSAGLSVIGRSANSTGNVADITASANDQFLVRRANALTWGGLQVADIPTGVDHGGLSGLADDDHSQYALLAGRSTGQTLIGGSASLTLVGGTSTTADLNFKTTTGVGATGADIHFLVGNNGSIEAMTILNNGNIGINKTDPSGSVEINKSDYSGRIVFSQGAITDKSVTSAFADSNGACIQQIANGYLDSGGSLNQYNSAKPSWRFQLDARSTQDNFNVARTVPAGSTTVLFRINNAGDVGIGIGSGNPGSKLQVGGDIQIDLAGAIYLGDPSSNGTWRIIRSGNDLLSQRRESGVYVTKQTITP